MTKMKTNLYNIRYISQIRIKKNNKLTNEKFEVLHANNCKSK